MRKTSFFVFSAAGLIVGLVTAAEGATLGLPIFMTAPTSVSITNQFGPDLAPTPSYTLGLHSTIASAQGAPELVGQTIDFTWFFDGGFDDMTIPSNLRIGGVEILTDPLMKTNELLAIPPYTSVFDSGTGLDAYSYDGFFVGFGPRIGTYPDVVLHFVLNALIPTKDGYRYCTSDQSFCEFSNIAGLTEIGGEVVSVQESFLGYPEGQIVGAVMTFSTVDGRPVAPVPLPLGGAMLLGALGGLAAVRRWMRG